jgi:hypothetical protein
LSTLFDVLFGSVGGFCVDRLSIALAGGNNNPGRGKFHHANRQQPFKQQHLNHQFQTVNVPTNIHYNNNKQPTSNHHEQNGHTIRYNFTNRWRLVFISFINS